MKNKINLDINKKKIGIIILGIILLVIILTISIKINSKVNLTCTQMEQIVLEKLSGGTIIKCELERKTYEVQVIHNKLIYEFEVNANTGEIIDYEAEPIENR